MRCQPLRSEFLRKGKDEGYVGIHRIKLETPIFSEVVILTPSEPAHSSTVEATAWFYHNNYHWSCIGSWWICLTCTIVAIVIKSNRVLSYFLVVGLFFYGSSTVLPAVLLPRTFFIEHCLRTHTISHYCVISARSATQAALNFHSWVEQAFRLSPRLARIDA